jgi:hypothetical protein
MAGARAAQFMVDAMEPGSIGHRPLGRLLCAARERAVWMSATHLARATYRARAMVRHIFPLDVGRLGIEDSHHLGVFPDSAGAVNVPGH